MIFLNKIKTKYILIAIAVLIVAYIAGVVYHKNRFPANTYINDIKVSRLTLEQADKKLDEEDSWDTITIKSDDETFLEIKSGEIDYKYIEAIELPEILDEQNEWNWLISSFIKSEYKSSVVSEFNEEKLKNLISSIDELDKELSNAQVVFSEAEDRFIIKPHSYEIQISEKELFELVEENIEKCDPEINIEKYIEQPPIFKDNPELIAAKDQANNYLDIQLTYDFADRKEIVDNSVLKDIITIDGKQVDLSRDKAKEFVVEIARKYDTFGMSREFKTTSGKTITVSGGSYGWLINRSETTEQLLQLIKEGKDKTIEPIYSYEASIRKKDDIGNSYVEIDLDNQMVYLYIDGNLKVETPTVTGNVSQGHGTPTGVYPINYKERNATLTGETYESPVDYWMPFNKDIGLHDADWRDEFGGDLFETSGSHGCINLPPGDAKTIFDSVYPGMPVIVH